MRHLTAVVFGLLLFQGLAFAETYKIDKDHSNISFTVKHMGISNVRGQFKDFEGTLNFDEKNAKADGVDVKIKSASIDTSVEKRDEHLKSPDFLDAQKYPDMTFKTKKVVKAGSKYKIEGLLTLHGVEKPVTLTAEFGGTTKDPYGNQRVAFTATGKIDRTQFGLVWNKPMEKAGALMVGNDINITLDVEAIQEKTKDEKTEAKN